MFRTIRRAIEGLLAPPRKFVQYIADTSPDEDMTSQSAFVRKCDSVEELARMGANYSGYVREAVVKRCVELRDPAVLPVVAARLNDWVEQVRDAARLAMVSLTPSMPASAQLQVLPTILDLARMSRTDHSQWQAHYEALLLQTMSPEDFVEGLDSCDHRVARASFTMLARYNLIARERLAALGFAKNADIVLALQALACLEQLPEELRKPLYKIAIRSRFGAIRASALRFELAEGAEEEGTANAKCALFDQHWSVRAAAVTFLRASGFDLQAFYRAVLLNPVSSTAELKIGLSALASLNVASDLVLVKGFIEARTPALRRTALAAWLMLKPEDKDLIAIEALRDSSPAVRRFSSHVIQRKGAYVPFEVIRSHLERQGDWYLLLSLSQMNKWDWLSTIALVAARIKTNGIDEERLRFSLRSWRLKAGSRYESPTAQQLEFLKSESAQLALCQLTGDPRTPIPFIEIELQGR